MERLFLDHTYRWLAMDGVLAMVIPFERLMDCAGLLSSHFTALNVFRMTDEESVRFRQIAVLGVRSNIRGSASLIYVDRNAYSVPSRLIGEQVEARLFMEHVEVWYGQKKVAEMPRLRGRQKHRVDYRHIIDWLVRKPGAFEHYRYRSELFPTSRFRMTFDLLEEQLGRYQGSKEYLKILELAARDSEVMVDAALLVLLGPGDEPISAAGIEAMLGAEQNTTVRDVEVAVVDLRVFDQLFTAQEVLQ
jgi:hypothetical protein